ncbi:MAG TPA: YfbM family protein [Opitutaceae bacterium]|nr:YfbM family protein [Opitutaceae bacterium]
MCLSLIRLSDATIAELRSTPAKALHFWLQDELAAPAPVGFIGRLLGRKEEEHPKCSAPREEADDAEIDKAWDALDYLISEQRKKTGLARFLTEGGIEIPEELGYGGPRVFSSEEVREIARLLEAVSQDTLRANYDPKKMNEEGVYPQIWVQGGADLFDYVVGNFVTMKSLVSDAATRGQGMMIVCS